MLTDKHLQSILESDQKHYAYVVWYGNGGDRQVRLTAIEHLEDQRELASLALWDSDYHVREAAIRKLKYRSVLKTVSIRDSYRPNRTIASERLKSLPKDLVSDDERRVRLTAVEHLDDQDALERIALYDSDYLVRQAAILKLNNMDVLKVISLIEGDYCNHNVANKRLYELYNEE